MQLLGPVHTVRSPFRSFWQVGYEGADHINGRGIPLRIPERTGHLHRAKADYAQARLLHVRTVRESLGWRDTDLGNGSYDFSAAGRLEEDAKAHGIQILWTLCHYGLPRDLTWFSDGLIDRFARFCKAFARYLAEEHPQSNARVFTPINEISFLAWAVCETGLMSPRPPECGPMGYALKRRLVQASIAGMEAIWEVDPQSQVLNVDPLIAVVAADSHHSDLAGHMAALQYQAWDMLAGLHAPELGGSRRHLGLVGINYYPSNQWEVPSGVPLAGQDSRRIGLDALLVKVWERYEVPLVISETSHTGSSKAPWLHEVTHAACRATTAGVPLLGICLYPALNRPDWEAPDDWHDSGLWRVCPASLERTLDLSYAQALHGARTCIDGKDTHLMEANVMKPSPSTTLIVLSHLRWDFVYQRPQHLLSRLAKHFDVIFVQEPARGDQGMQETQPCAGVTVLQPTHPEGGTGYSDNVMPFVAASLARYLAERGVREYAAWFYTPMALPVLEPLSPRCIVYDCMDELTGFKNAPPQLAAREAKLLDIANAVFTGGPSLFQAKCNSNPNVHCFPSSVDAAHFQRAQDGSLADPVYDPITRPRLGFFGVIDERLDIVLIETLARRRPEWQICLVGPIVKIDPATLPTAPNIHYFPQQAYEALPAALAAWDVCLLPFALNDATRFISPTKTLEYMCAQKPVVSTAIADVRTLYASGVAVAEDVDAFEKACFEALTESKERRQHRSCAQRELVATTSWETTAEAMRAIIDDALDAGLKPAAANYLAHPNVVPIDTARAVKADSTPCLIVGAGPTGLSAAMNLGARSILVDANATVGGWCRSIKDAGFTFDYAGHIMFSREPYVLQLYDKLLGANLHWQDREAWVFSKNVYTRYPFQGALYGLPPKVLTECLMGAIEARFGPVDNDAPPARASDTSTHAGAGGDCCADGTVDSCQGDVKDLAGGTPGSASRRPPPANFRDFINEVWGAGVAKHFAIPYNTKLWTVPLEDMETSWLGGRVPLPNLEEMIAGAVSPVPAPVGPNARFGYPLRGGFAALMEGFLPLLDGRLMLNERMIGLDVAARCAHFASGRQIRYDRMISTIPLPQLVAILGDSAPTAVRKAAQGLRHVSVKCVNLGIGRDHLTDKHWIYFPEDTVFHRVFVQGNASPHNNPIGGFGLTCEITYSETKPLPGGDQDLIDRCIKECIEVGLFSATDEIITANVVDMPYAYVIYDHARAENVRTIRQWLENHGVILAGRYSEWEYYNSDHAFLAGKKAAETISQRAQVETA